MSEFGRVCERRQLQVNVGKGKVTRCTRYVNVGRMQELNIGIIMVHRAFGFCFVSYMVTLQIINATNYYLILDMNTPSIA